MKDNGRITVDGKYPSVCLLDMSVIMKSVTN